MRKGIHPEYYPDAKLICSCGNTFTVGSTQKVIRTDVCSACHPFFTGEQRLVDTGGQVERFIRRLEKSEEIRAEEQARLEVEGEEEAEAEEVEEKVEEEIIESTE
jgi:large subunit ribosomal protein L31